MLRLAKQTGYQRGTLFPDNAVAILLVETDGRLWTDQYIGNKDEEIPRSEPTLVKHHCVE